MLLALIQFFCIQDSADGEFSRVKTRLAMHTVKHPEDEVGYIVVKDSESFQRFGEQQLGKPGPRSKLLSRYFIDMKAEEVLERKRDVGKVGTLAEITSMYHYVCKPSGEVLWRRYPCCCPACMGQRWNECLVPELVGMMEIVVPEGKSLYRA